ncbi:MAG: SDR family oxidoreductase [Bacteroidetes bacterium]|nr:SDR family oxidoreductase [Bacteroidota bacterium]
MKIALVTGAYKGLGLEWCKQLSNIGYTVILTARDIEKAKEAALIMDPTLTKVIPKALEVTDEHQIRELVDWVNLTFGKLDVLINNAGINSGTRAKGDKELAQKNLSLEILDATEVLNMFHINAIAPVLVAKYFKGVLAKAEIPKIINIGSWLGSISIKTTGGNYSYAVSKSALNMMTRALAFDLVKENIITVVVNPGWVQTDMGGGKAALTTEQSVKGLLENVLHKITLQDNGKFLQWDGSEHTW